MLAADRRCWRRRAGQFECGGHGLHNPADFTKPLAIGAPAPPLERRARRSRQCTPVIATLALFAACLLLAGTAVALAASKAVTVHTSADGVTATVSYNENTGAVAPYSDLHLTIARDGKVLQDAAVKVSECGIYCYPAEPNPAHVVDVEGDGQPDVLLDVYTGGAHCCYVLDLFRYDARTNGYEQVQHDFGDPGYRLERLEGKPQYELVSADDRFAYEFAAYVYSGLPLQIWRIEAGQFIDVTRSYPALITADAASWWKDWIQGRKSGSGNGELAAWAADEYELGDGSRVAQVLAQAEAAHELRSGGFGPSGAGYVKSLDRFLRQTGYIA